MVTDWLHLHGLIEGRSDSADWAKGKQPPLPTFLPLWIVNKKESSQHKRERRGGRERILEKNTVSAEKPVAGQRKRGELGEIPEVWGEQNKSCNQRGKEEHERRAHQEVSTAAVNMN
ncbi:hypothetical protein DEO72_LG8g1996 [Vigna unguiculata]|uniref:Uncharacterized protein n=1 Tax=Vigna unguiculata TaxID=3917 RepID=A0A4D6MT68_VIGUN|nr:hypothetical protein DEO72_LG8g1996 [Vigna unguiculata]